MVSATLSPKLKPGNQMDLFGYGRFAYHLRVKVTNDTGQNLKVPDVRQQAVLYGRHGHVVGGVYGSSDKLAGQLDAGESYREVMTGIPARKHADSVKYAVWLEGPTGRGARPGRPSPGRTARRAHLSACGSTTTTRSGRG